MNKLLVGRKRAAHAGRRLLLVLVRAADHGVNLQPGRGLDDVLDPVEIVDAGQLDQDLVVAQAVLLNRPAR